MLPLAPGSRRVHNRRQGPPRGKRVSELHSRIDPDRAAWIKEYAQNEQITLSEAIEAAIDALRSR